MAGISALSPVWVQTVYSDPQLARRISISISSISESIALAPSFGRRQLKKQFCASVAEARFHTAWAKRRNTRYEQMTSALAPPTTDIQRLLRHVRFVPTAELYSHRRHTAIDYPGATTL